VGRSSIVAVEEQHLSSGLRRVHTACCRAEEGEGGALEEDLADMCRREEEAAFAWTRRGDAKMQAAQECLLQRVIIGSSC